MRSLVISSEIFHLCLVIFLPIFPTVVDFLGVRCWCSWAFSNSFVHERFQEKVVFWTILRSVFSSSSFLPFIEVSVLYTFATGRKESNSPVIDPSHFSADVYCQWRYFFQKSQPGEVLKLLQGWRRNPEFYGNSSHCCYQLSSGSFLSHGLRFLSPLVRPLCKELHKVRTCEFAVSQMISCSLCWIQPLRNVVSQFLIRTLRMEDCKPFLNGFRCSSHRNTECRHHEGKTNCGQFTQKRS